MDKITLIPDEDFKKISKTVKELRNAYYDTKDLKVDFISLLFTRIDELLACYSKALNENADNETFTIIKSGLLENIYILDIALSINDIEEIKQIEHKRVSKFEMFQDEFNMFPEHFRGFGLTCFSYNQNINDLKNNMQ